MTPYDRYFRCDHMHKHTYCEPWRQAPTALTAPPIDENEASDTSDCPQTTYVLHLNYRTNRLVTSYCSILGYVLH